MIPLSLNYEGVRGSFTYRFLLEDVHVRLRSLFMTLGLTVHPEARVMYVYNKVGQVASNVFDSHPLVLPINKTQNLIVNTHADCTVDRSAHGASKSGFPTAKSFATCAKMPRPHGKIQNGQKKRTISDFFATPVINGGSKGKKVKKYSK